MATTWHAIIIIIKLIPPEAKAEKKRIIYPKIYHLNFTHKTRLKSVVDPDQKKKDFACPWAWPTTNNMSHPPQVRRAMMSILQSRPGQ